jgi:tetratricopeptide (TPR) repeat protein
MAAKQTKKNKAAVLAKKVPVETISAPVSANPWLPAGIVAAFAFLLYANTFGHDFVLDDPLVTSINKFVQQGFSGLADIFTHSYRAGSAVSTDSEYMYRPLSVASFAMEWAIAPNAPGFHHFLNVLWFALTAGLLYRTLTKIIPGNPRLLALAATALFVAHPIHTEVVANIKSRDEIMSLFFSLLTLNLYWDYAVSRLPSPVNRLWWALGTFFLALLAKEGAVTMLLIIPLTLYCFAPDTKPVQAIRQSLWLLIPFALWFVIRIVIMHGKLGYNPDFNDNPLVAAGLTDRWATGFVILGKYLQLLIWPAALSWDYSFNQLPTVGWSDMKAIGFFVLHAGLFGYALWNLRKRTLVSFSILAYLVSLGLYTNLFLLIGTPFGERLAYTASIWFCLVVAYGLYKGMGLSENSSDTGLFDSGKSKLFAGVIFILLLPMIFRTISRNHDWKNNYNLFTADRYSAPNSFRTQRAAGEQILQQYDKIKTDPKANDLLHDAENCFKKSLEIRPTENAWIGMGQVAYYRKDYLNAAIDFKNSLQLRPNNQPVKPLLISCYQELGKHEGQVNNNLPKALEYFQSALQVDSTDSQTLRLMGTAYGLQSKHEEAVRYFEKALVKAPNDPELLKNISIGYRLLGNTAKAEQYERKPK